MARKRETLGGTIIFKHPVPSISAITRRNVFHLHGSWQNSDDNQPCTCPYVHGVLDRLHEVRTSQHLCYIHDVKIHIQNMSDAKYEIQPECLGPHAVTLIAIVLKRL
jgi:hypothetical protein